MRVSTALRAATTAASAAVLCLLPLSSPAQATVDDEHCVLVLDELRHGQEESAVLSYACFPDARSRDRSHQAAADTLLMTWYDLPDFAGGSTQVRGDFGGCDGEGYGIAYVGDDWNDRVSSFRTFNGCNTVSGYHHANYGADAYYCGKCGDSGFSESYVGSGADNAISSFWISRL
ncbi:hypothetical protein KGD83_01835 [Nocardiopsis akebiae]|uniref:Uncharacterized protein n=1 Tax=Nocardiopsis akebiae TaxID=2831968 RepID=A0ABX8C639_9ACTN|nr:hypothetical protein [Nocardiopsis akebiae]QUX29365.1 hypothetical protein KGD83_01835 [Nocardiopsis akebiae]